MPAGKPMPNPSARVYIAAALIGAVALIVAAWIGRSSGVSTGREQAFATAEVKQSTSVAQVAVTEIVITQVAITQISITQVAVTQIVATSPLAPTSTNMPEPTAANTPEPLPPGSFVDEFNTLSTESWEIASPGLIVTGGELSGKGMILYTPKSNNYRINARIKGGDFRIHFRSAPFTSGFTTYNGYDFSCEEKTCFWRKTYWLCELTCADTGTRTTGYERTKIPFDTKRPHDVSITVNEGSFSFNVDGKQVLDTADQTFAEGQIGIGGNDLALDRIEIIPLP